MTPLVTRVSLAFCLLLAACQPVVREETAETTESVVQDPYAMTIQPARTSTLLPSPSLTAIATPEISSSETLSALAGAITTPTVPPATTLVLSAEDEERLALKTLFDFFDLLHAGEYEQASHLYGGTYETLMYLNPSIHPNDKEAYFKNGCEINGLVCLPVSEAVLQETGIPQEFRFIVEFKNDDGARFVLGPCCGATETEMPPKWQFPYTVVRIGDQFMVMDLPISMP